MGDNIREPPRTTKFPRKTWGIPGAAQTGDARAALWLNALVDLESRAAYRLNQRFEISHQVLESVQIELLSAVAQSFFRIRMNFY